MTPAAPSGRTEPVRDRPVFLLLAIVWIALTAAAYGIEAGWFRSAGEDGAARRSHAAVHGAVAVAGLLGILGARWIARRSMRQRDLALAELGQRNRELETLHAARADAERVLRESEQDNRRLWDNALDGLILVGDPSEILRANPAACAIFGRTEDELRRADRGNLLDLDDPRTEAALQEGGATGRFQGELTAIRADGTRFPVECSSTLFEDGRGHRRSIVVIRDIARRKQTQDALRRTVQRHEALVNNIDGIVWEADARTLRFTFVSATAAKLLGHPVSRWMSEPDFWRNRIHPDDRERAVRHSTACIRQGKAHELEYRMIAADGGEVWLRDLVSVELENGEPSILRGVMVDITPQKRTEQNVRRNEARLRQAQDLARLGWWEWDVETDQTIWSDEMFRIYGVDPEEFTGCGTDYLEFTHPDDRATQRENIRRAFESAAARARDGRERVDDAPDPHEFRIVRPDGSIRWVRGDSVDVVDVDGRPLRMHGILLDITQQKLAGIERRRLAAEIAQKNSELQSVLFAASHDLRTPLVNIHGFARRLEALSTELRSRLAPAADADTRPADPAVVPILVEEIPAAVRFIQSGAERIDALINGMIEVSRVGQAPAGNETLDLDRIVQRVLAILHTQVEAAGATVNVEPLPPCVGDATLIGQVFSNLVENAIRFRHPDRAPRIEVSGRVEGAGEVVYTVADNGIGIAPGDAERIWDLFQRLDPDGPPGEGIGLNLVRRIVDRHGGRAWVESVEGAGSRFHVALPAPR